MRFSCTLICLLFFIGHGSGALVRTKRDGGGGDFLSNLGNTLNKMLGSFLGANKNPGGPSPQNQQSQQPLFQVQAPPQQQNSPMVVQPQQQIQPNQDLPTLGTNSAYDRRVSQINKGRKQRLRPNQQQPPPQPNLPPQGPPPPQQQQQQGPPQQQRPIQIIDQNGKLSYCTDNPADCDYLSCEAENFQHSEAANNLQMAGKVLLDRNLRRAVANDPLISQAACDKVGLDQQGCQGFRQLLGIVDKFDPDPTTSKEKNRDPERNAGGRRKRAKTIDYDYDHVDVNANARSQGQSNVAPNENRPVAAAQNNGNQNTGRGPSNGNQFAGQGPNNGNQRGQSPNGNSAGPAQNGNRPTAPGPTQNGNNGRGTNSNQNGNGNVQRANGGPANANNGNNGQNNGNGLNNRPPFPSSSFTQRPSNGNSANRGRGGGTVDYSEYYENGASSSRGGSGKGNGGSGGGRGAGPGGNTDRGYKPRDCKAIARNARRG